MLHPTCHRGSVPAIAFTIRVQFECHPALHLIKKWLVYQFCLTSINVTDSLPQIETIYKDMTMQAIYNLLSLILIVVVGLLIDCDQKGLIMA